MERLASDVWLIFQITLPVCNLMKSVTDIYTIAFAKVNLENRQCYYDIDMKRCNPHNVPSYSVVRER